MKLSLKEFFLHEALGDQGDQSARSKIKKPPEPKQEALGDQGDQSARSKIKKPPPPPPEPKQEAAGCSSSKMDEHEDPTTVSDKGASILSDPTQPANVKKFSSRDGQLHIDLKEMFLHEAGPIIRKKPVDPKSLPDEMPDDFDVDTSDFDSLKAEPQKEPELGFSDTDAMGAGMPKSDQPANPSGFEPQSDDPFAAQAGDDDLDWLDDPGLAKGVQVPKASKKAAAPAEPAPKKDHPYTTFDPDQYGPFVDAPKGKDKFWSDADEQDLDVLTWPELKAIEPDAADNIEREFPDIANPGGFSDTGIGRERRAFFYKDPQTYEIIARIHGSRYKWDDEKEEWIGMDDAGEL